MIGKLRTVFRAHGRQGRENPAAPPEVKRCLTFMREEQASSAAIPRQAIPFQPQKLEILLRFLYNRMVAPVTSPLQRYLFVRDIAFFVIDFFTAGRGSDLGRLETHSVFQLEGERSFLLNFTFGKTLRGHGVQSRPFILLPAPQLAVCPVFWFEYYLNYCRKMHIHLHPGYVFRASVGQTYACFFATLRRLRNTQPLEIPSVGSRCTCTLRGNTTQLQNRDGYNAQRDGLFCGYSRFLRGLAIR